MWQFMVATFGCLFFAFYHLSGGADYQPAENSFQTVGYSPSASVAYAMRNQPAEEPRVDVAEITTVLTSQQETQPRVQVTLASAVAATSEPTLQTGSNKAERLTQPAVAVDAVAVQAALTLSEEDDGQQVWPGAIELFALQAQQAEVRAELKAKAEIAERAALDIRFVTGDVVNMRDGPGTAYQKIASLHGGTEVSVLNAPGNGWLELQVLETGEVGWMADWLVSAAN